MGAKALLAHGHIGFWDATRGWLLLNGASPRPQSVGEKCGKAGLKTIPGMYLNASASRAAGHTLLAVEDRASKDRSGIRWTVEALKTGQRASPAPRGHTPGKRRRAMVPTAITRISRRMPDQCCGAQFGCRGNGLLVRKLSHPIAFSNSIALVCTRCT